MLCCHNAVLFLCFSLNTRRDERSKSKINTCLVSFCKPSKPSKNEATSVCSPQAHSHRGRHGRRCRELVSGCMALAWEIGPMAPLLSREMSAGHSGRTTARAEEQCLNQKRCCVIRGGAGAPKAVARRRPALHRHRAAAGGVGALHHPSRTLGAWMNKQGSESGRCEKKKKAPAWVSA